MAIIFGMINVVLKSEYYRVSDDFRNSQPIHPKISSRSRRIVCYLYTRFNPKLSPDSEISWRVEFVDSGAGN